MAQRDVERARVGAEQRVEAALEEAHDARPAASSAPRRFRKRLASIGTRVSETKAETTIASATTTANSWNSRPITPGMKKIGMNTATSEIEIDRMVKPTSREPLSAAWNGASPSSTWRMMFSSMTIASSTTSPTASVMPSSEMLSRL